MRITFSHILCSILILAPLTESAPSFVSAAKNFVTKQLPKFLTGAVIYVGADAVADQLSPSTVTREIVYTQPPAVPNRDRSVVAAPVPFTPSQVAPLTQMFPPPDTGKLEKPFSIHDFLERMETRHRGRVTVQELPDDTTATTAIRETHTTLYIVGGVVTVVILLVISYVIKLRFRRAKPTPLKKINSYAPKAAQAPAPALTARSSK